MSPHRRPDYSPEQRLAILQLMRLRGWSISTIASRFVLHENTVRTWVQTLEGKRPVSRLLGIPRWNRIDDAVRWAVHELRRLFPETEFGTRTIAHHLVRAGIAISRRTVQRVCREDQPTRPMAPRPPITTPAGVEPNHLLAPTAVNRVWHLDLAEHRFLWLRVTIAVLLDGCSRKLLRLTAFTGSPTSAGMIALVDGAVAEHGRPKFLITDHGCQFRRTFRRAMRKVDIRHVRGKVRCPSFNGKAERLIRTLRLWIRGVLLPITVQGIQKRLNHFQEWYNTQRPHAALDGRPPDEAWHDQLVTPTIPYRARNDCPPAITVRRIPFRDDPRLPVVRIDVQRRQAA